MTKHNEFHRSDRIGWLRASVLGANDGIVSTASLILGVAAAHVSQDQILVTGIAGLVAGAMSMAAGEYVSVSSQSDTEAADLAREKEELVKDIDHEHDELAQIYQGRGLDAELAKEVARQLMLHDALGSHARDELGINEKFSARPVQAALASALTFAVGAALPLSLVLISPLDELLLWVSITSLLCLAILGGLAAQVGGANMLKGAIRVIFWGAFAMGLTAGIGSLFGVAI